MRSLRTLLIVVAAGLAAVACNGKSGSNTATADDMTMGNDKAPATLIEYASVACPHCAAFNNDVFPEFKKKYIDTGKVHYISREQLTGDTRMAAAGFLVARCAGKDKYFQVTDAIYRNQQGVYTDMRNGLLNIAKSAGMSEADFDKCLADEKAINALNDRVEKFAKENKITGTPTFFVNGKEIASGEITMAQLDKAMADAGVK